MPNSLSLQIKNQRRESDQIDHAVGMLLVRCTEAENPSFSNEFPLQIFQTCEHGFMHLNADDLKIRSITVDPGGPTSGAYALSKDGMEDITLYNLNSIVEFIDHVRAVADKYPTNAIVEAVPAFAGKDVPSSRIFPLARNYGTIEGIFRALGIPMVQYSPRKWQSKIPKLKGLSGAPRKRAIRDFVDSLYPQAKATLRQADALGIAAYHFSLNTNHKPKE